MIYCAIEEAFNNNNNSLKKETHEYQINKFNNKRDSYESKIVEPNTFDNYTDMQLPVKNSFVNNIIQHPTTFPAYFTAQGDMNECKNLNLNSSTKQEPPEENFGTSIFDLNQPTLKENDLPSISIIDSPASEDSFLSSPVEIPKKEDKLDHTDHVNIFLNCLNSQLDIDSLTSKYNNSFDHIKSCKTCRSKIKNKLKKDIIEPFDTEIKYKSEKSKPILKEYFNLDSYGYDIKELLIIIIIGIVLIFFLDLLVKLARKGKN